ncbi:TPA: hypothetical protein VA109_000677 [Streptococcus agalactiae]|nr:hypothetical protein [Streptococcus agalactiae]
MTTSIDDDEKTVWQTQGKPISEHDEILIVDKARKLKDGNYQIAGRIKEIINRAGEKITPLELEEILLTHDCINSVQVLGVPDKLYGEAIAVFILKSESKRLTLEEVRKFLISNNVADFKLPDAVKYIDSWPLTALGKIDRNKLKENF